MSPDRSLDEFLSTPDESADSGDGDSTDPAVEPDPEAGDVQSVEPATATFVYSPTGGECDDCGERVARRWRDGDRVVCAECKEW